MLRISMLLSVATIAILAAALNDSHKQTTASPTRAVQAMAAPTPTSVVEETSVPAAPTTAAEGTLGPTPATTAVQETLAPAAEMTVVQGTAPTAAATTGVREMPEPTPTSVVEETRSVAAGVAVQQ